MSASFTNQVLAQIDLYPYFTKGTSLSGMTYDEPIVSMLPKTLDEEVARLHIAHLGVKLTKLSQEQADYIGVPVDGPYKPEHYRY